MSNRLLSHGPRVLLMAAALFAAPCQALDTATLSSLYLSSDFYTGLIQQVSKPTLAAGQRSVLGKLGPPPLTTMRDGMTETLTANLSYQPLDGISRTLRQQIATKVARADPGQAPQIRSALASDSIWQQFNQVMGDSGYDVRNIADVMASYYVAGWEIVNRKIVQPNFASAARMQIIWSLKRSPEIMFLSDAEKQRSAEALGIMTTVSTIGSRMLAQQNDPIGAVTLQEMVYQSFLQQGVDLKLLTLGRNGFIAN
jgi:hypothetical protein